MSTASPSIESTFRTFPLPRLADVCPQVFVRREEIPKALLAAESTTYGWDTVNCIRLPIVNQVLAASDQYPKELKTTLNADQNWTIDTSYGPWQIVAGGSGAILRMALPLTKATMTYGDKSLTFQNGSATIRIKLRYVPQNPGRFTDPDDQNPVDIEDLIADAEARTPEDPAVAAVPQSPEVRESQHPRNRWGMVMADPTPFSRFVARSDRPARRRPRFWLWRRHRGLPQRRATAWRCRNWYLPRWLGCRPDLRIEGGQAQTASLDGGSSALLVTTIDGRAWYHRSHPSPSEATTPFT
jgi:hypothetical protein